MTIQASDADGEETVSVSLRRPLLMQATLRVLAERDGPIPAGTVLAQVAERIELTDAEKSLNKSGAPRYDTFIRFATGWMKTIGWMTKTRSEGWALTDAGRSALESLDADELYRVSTQEYREIYKARKAGGGYAGPRWQTVRDGIAAIPEGSWTAYGDLGALAGLNAQSVGNFLSANLVPGAHRVLDAGGTIAEGFLWPDPDRDDDVRTVLEEEGLEFDSRGRATPDSHLGAEDLRLFVATPATGRRVWLIRSSLTSLEAWLTDGFVSIDAGPLPLEADIDLKPLVEDHYSHLSYSARRSKLAELNAFVNRMADGDIVVTTRGRVAFVGIIEGGVTGDRRPVAWHSRDVSLAELPEALRARLRSSAPIADLTDVADSVEALLAPQPVEAARTAAPEVRLPDLSPEQADELLVGKEWLADFVDLLRTRRQLIVHGPPGTGKTYLSLEIANSVTDPANVTLVQFHPAYSYEDFFEGYRPTGLDDGGRAGFALAPGPFRKIVDRAREDPATPYILIIDEINRANLAKVFGELYFLLEYRDRAIDLMYSSGDEGRDFTLPNNVYVVGTMNTADRSIALVDSAMRRRFAFLSLHPDDEHLRGVLRVWLERRSLSTEAADLLDVLNARIPEKDFKVGPSYLMHPEAAEPHGLERIWRTSILPLLEELHYGEPGFDVHRRYGLSVLRRAYSA